MNSEKAPSTRERILLAAADLVAAGGVEAASTRAVAAAAGVQAPTLYRLFGDKQGLLDAVAAHGFERYLAGKHAMSRTDDPVEDLRRGWDLHVDYGLSHPSFYVLMYGTARPGEPSATALEARRVLVAMLERVARAGRLRLPVEEAARMVQAAGVGVTLTLIEEPAAGRDTSLSARTREMVLGAVTTDPVTGAGEAGLAARAVALNASLPGAPDALSPAETALLREWLRRLASR